MVSDGTPIILILLVCVMNRYGRFISLKLFISFVFDGTRIILIVVVCVKNLHARFIYP